MKWRFVEDISEVRYLDNPPAEFRRGMHHKDPATPAWHKRPSQFMFRKHSRITLEIASVRVERVQDISEADARAEGADPEFEIDVATFVRGSFDPATASTYRLGFKHLWDSINKARGYGWSANPGVWVVSFKRLAEALPIAA